MSCDRRTASGLVAFLVLLGGTVGLSAQPGGSERLKQPELPKNEPSKEAKDSKPFVVKLPDGTHVWLGNGPDGERVTLSPQEFQKLLDQIDSLKKELAARKPRPPSSCAIRGRIEKRGEQLVAALKLTYAFRTTHANTAVALGARRAFLVAAALDGTKLPVLETADDGFAVTVESPGEHTLFLDVEVPVTVRGTKAEVGFDLALPRAPITTLALDPPDGTVKRVNLVTRTPDPTLPLKLPETRRFNGLDLQQLAASGQSGGFPLGAVESVEVTWEAAGSPPVDTVQSAEWDITTILTVNFVESTAKVKLRGPALVWKLVAPANADVSVDRSAAAPIETGPTYQPVVTKPTDPAKPIWKVELPSGSTVGDWTVTLVVRQARPKAGAKSSAIPVGPFAVLDVLRQSGTVKVMAAPHTRFVFKHGPDLRRIEPPMPVDEENSVAFFRLTSGPTGSTAAAGPLLTVEAYPVEGTVRVTPAYKLKLTEAGWLIHAEITVRPIRTEVETLVLEVPAEWRGLESESDPLIVEGVTQGPAAGLWRPVTVRLAKGMAKPFDIVLVATLPLPPTAREAHIPLFRFPQVIERDTTLSASVPEGWEIRGHIRGWDGDDPAAWSMPLDSVASPDGKRPKVTTQVSGQSPLGVSRVSLSWQPYRPDISAEIRTDVTLGERQMVVAQVLKLRSTDGFPKAVRFRGPPETMGLKTTPALEMSSAGTWSYQPPTDARETTLRLSFALALPGQTDGPLSIPVGMFWPLDVARVETTVRVWVNTFSGRTVTAASPGWREWPPEPLPERDVLPALTLTASAERPLALEVGPVNAGTVATLRIERTLIEAGLAEDGFVHYRARFRLPFYLVSTVEVLLPEKVATNPVVRIDGLVTSLTPVGGDETTGRRRYRLTLPEGPGRACILEITYATPGSRRAIGETRYEPPELPFAAYTGPVRWLIAEPSDSAPLVFGEQSLPEILWRLRGMSYAPTAASRLALDQWFLTGTEPGAEAASDGSEGELIVVRQVTPEAVRVVRLPWLGLAVVCSLFVAVVMLVLTWCPPGVVASAITLGGCALGLCGVLYPQPAAQWVAAGQPGFFVGMVAIAIQAVIRWQARRRITHLPGFSRVSLEPSVAAGVSTASLGTPSPPSSRSSSRTGGNAASGSSAPPAPTASGT